MPNGKTMVWSEGKDYPTYYSNLMGIGMTPFDIAVVFGQVGDSTDTEVVGHPQCKLILTPEQASNLVKLLTATLSVYEKNNGGLRTAGAVNLQEFEDQITPKAIQ